MNTTLLPVTPTNCSPKGNATEKQSEGLDLRYAGITYPSLTVPLLQQMTTPLPVLDLNLQERSHLIYQSMIGFVRNWRD